MITRLVNSNVSERRRKFALLISFIIHGFATIILGVWLIKPMIEDIDDTLYVDLVSEDLKQRDFRADLPKPIPKMVHKMETAEINSRTVLRLRRCTDVYRFMTNLLIYTLKYGGNTDRSEYKE